MAKLKDILAYLLAHYPESLSDELSNARVTKMIYLADWRNCLGGKGQISDVDWYFDNFGPFVWDVKETAKSHPELFEVKNVPNMYGSPKTLFALKDKEYEPKLSPGEIESIDHIIKIGSEKYWNDFIKLVYSTHPIASSERYSSLDLIDKAAEYKKQRDA